MKLLSMTTTITFPMFLRAKLPLMMLKMKLNPIEMKEKRSQSKPKMMVTLMKAKEEKRLRTPPATKSEG